MHGLLKSLYIRRVSADYGFAIFRDVTYKLYLHHFLLHIKLCVIAGLWYVFLW
jgi:hypothetical protein